MFQHLMQLSRVFKIFSFTGICIENTQINLSDDNNKAKRQWSRLAKIEQTSLESF